MEDDDDADDDEVLGAVEGRVATPGARARELGRGGGVVWNGSERSFWAGGVSGEIFVAEGGCCCCC